MRRAITGVPAVSTAKQNETTRALGSAERRRPEMLAVAIWVISLSLSLSLFSTLGEFLLV